MFPVTAALLFLKAFFVGREHSVFPPILEKK